jgi:hypothetical protein
VLANGSDTVSPTADATSFEFPTTLANGVYYDAAVQAQPSGQSCQISNGRGPVSGADVTTIIVGCVAGAWTWQGGGPYGSPDDRIPSPRFGAASWTDTAGNFWVFGGTLGEYTGVFYNDLWEYSQTDQKWYWYSGSLTANALGVYGTQGVAGGVPGARAYSVAWADTSGNLWLFGGDIYQPGSTEALPLNDLWEFNTSTAQWIWVGGSNGQTIDIAGDVPPPTNYGGPTSAWTDHSGNFWLYGNPLWEYVPSTGQWTQVGTQVTDVDNISGAVYGTEGVPAVGNYPGTREGSASWTDAQGNLWLFGGGFNACTDDMWEYMPSTGQWEWVSGSNYIQLQNIAASAVYGTLGVAAPGNSPGCRIEAISWADGAGNIWLYGGFGYKTPETFGDLFEYSTTSSTWIWMGSGPQNVGDAAAVYGTLGVPSESNSPGSRSAAVGWVRNGNQLWLFGGANGDPGANPDYEISETAFNDFWVYSP